MPKVTYEYEDGTRRSGSGGCFGFCGKHGNIKTIGSHNSQIEKVIYHYGQQWGGASISGILDPRPIIEWLAEHSMWSKYILRIETSLSPDASVFGGENAYNIVLTSDAPGHAIIGTMSAIRYLSKRKGDFVPLMNQALTMGVNLSIMYLVWYAMSKKTNEGFKIQDNKFVIHQGNGSVITSGDLNKQGLGDDEVMHLDKINPNDIYSIIQGTYKYPTFNRGNLRTAKCYNQHILESFRTPRPTGTRYHGFGNYLVDRFMFPLVSPDLSKVREGMGTRVKATHGNSCHPYMLLYIAAQLTQEWKKSQEFKGYF